MNSISNPGHDGETHENTDQDQASLLKEIAQLRTEVDLLRRPDSLRFAIGRPPMSGQDSGTGRYQASQFVTQYIRQGMTDGIERKALSTTVGADGAYALPRELDARIDATLKAISPIRSVASVVSVASSSYRKLVTTGGVASGWVSEVAGRPETDTPDFVEVAPPMGDLYANPAASQAMLDDAGFDVESWLAEEIATEFARAEGAAFVNGSGVSRPKGFLTYPTATTPDAARPFGTLQHVPTGVAGAFPSANPQDKLIDLVHALRPAYRQGAVFVMNSATLARIRKMKDGDGNFIWRPGLSEAQAATLLGYEIIEAEDMPDVGTDSPSIAFGNFGRGYVIVERSATQILRDPYSNKPFVHFYATKRVGGSVVNSEAIKLLKFSVN